MLNSEIICQALKFGEHNAIKSAELEQLTGLTSRDVKREIASLRRSGVVICSSSKGYFYADSKSELGKFIHQETARKESIGVSLKSAIDLYESMGGDDACRN